MRALFAPFALLFAAAACGGEPAPIARYTAALDGSDAMVAILIEDESVLAYVCGGATTVDSMTRWYSGQLEARAELAAANGGARLTFRIDGDELRGELEQGSLHTFRANRAEPDSATGLYDARTSDCRTGVIVTEREGEVMHTQGASCASAGRFAQVSPDGPVTRSGFMVRVGDSTPIVRMFVEPSAP